MSAKWTFLVEKEEPLLEVGKPPLTETDLAIGRNVARLVEDGATIHAGLGHLPSAALICLKDKKDLGIHTDMLTDSTLELIRSGAVTNQKKEIHRKKVVASYCLGTRELLRLRPSESLCGTVSGGLHQRSERDQPTRTDDFHP